MKPQDQLKTVRRVFDEWADTGRADGLEHHHGPSARPAFERLSLREDSRYLDIGCGSGYSVRWAASACPRGSATGLDLSSSMIRCAEHLAGDLPNVRFLCAEFPERELPEQGFDGILSMETFYYLPDLPAALERVRALLAPKGRFACVVDYYAENTASHPWMKQLGTDMRLLSSLGWSGAFERAGLKVLEQTRIRLPPADGIPAWKTKCGSLLTLGARDIAT